MNSQRTVWFLFSVLAILLAPGCGGAKVKPSAPAQESPAAPIIVEEKIGSEDIAAADPGTGIAESRPQAQTPPLDPEQRVCLVLGPGMARGLAHVGVIEALVEAKIKIHCVVGVEMGAIVGALYADTLNANTLQWQLFKFKRDIYLDTPLLSLRERLATGDRIHKVLSEVFANRRIRDLRIPFAAMGTAAESGDPYAFTQELVADAVTASTALALVFRPRNVEGRGLFVSGASSSPLPIAEAKRLGGTMVIAVDLLTDGFSAGNFSGTEREVARQFVIARNLQKFQRAEAALVISPDLRQYSFADFDRRVEIISIGKRAAAQALQAYQASQGASANGVQP